VSGGKIFISAGERSGDLHASNLIRAVRALRPDLEFEGFGGPRMREAGCELHRDMLDLSVMWASFAGHLRAFVRLIRDFWWHVRENRPRALVLVDYPGLHFILARIARAVGIPVIYYICPQIWAWAGWRRRKILRLTDLLMVILPFEVELYRDPKTPAVYVGHPLADDLLRSGAEAAAPEMRRGLEVPPGGKVIGLFPGSRRQEVVSIAPLMRDILERMDLDPSKHRLVVSACEEKFHGGIEEALAGLPLPVLIRGGDARVLMAACDFALVASGTATLELAYFGKPMVVLYRIHAWQMPFYRIGSTSPWISLVNILGGGPIVPEKVVVRPRAGDLADAARALFSDTPEREECIRRLAALRGSSFSPGGVDRAAGTLVDFLEGRPVGGTAAPAEASR
jgi:lipid-A-disaccharide synthase